MSTDDIDAADDAGDQIEDAADETTLHQRVFAKAWVVAVAAVIVAAAILAVRLGYVDPSITISASVDVGDELALLVRGLVVVFLAFTAIMALVAAPGSYVSAIISAAARIADNYQLPGDDDT